MGTKLIKRLDPNDVIAEIASILARAYLRILYKRVGILNTNQDPDSPPNPPPEATD